MRAVKHAKRDMKLEMTVGKIWHKFVYQHYTPALKKKKLEKKLIDLIIKT